MSTSFFSSRTHLITLELRGGKGGRGVAGGAGAGARRNSLALRCPALTTQPSGQVAGYDDGGGKLVQGCAVSAGNASGGDQQKLKVRR
jgi:hypothetical protein